MAIRFMVYFKSEERMQDASRRVIVVANRAPFCHQQSADGRIIVKQTASGVVTALQPLLAAYQGTWVAHGSGSADTLVVDERDGLGVEVGAGKYRLRFVWLSEEEHRGYYFGFANEGLWPLCHAMGVQPVFRHRDFQTYERVNEKFAAASAAESATATPIFLVQDYHFALAPRVLRSRVPASTVASFWHIPWPSPRVFVECPWSRQLLDGLLGSDIVGFQTDDDCRNFLHSVALLLDAEVDLARHTVEYRRRTTVVRAYPVGVDWDNQVVRTTPVPMLCRERVCRDLQLPANVRLAIGIDRLDYTKGINEKFLAVERLLETSPELRGHVVLVQVAEPSRDSLPEYRATRTQLVETSRRVNGRFGTHSYQPIRLLEAHHPPSDVYRLYRAADLCHVGSLRDGMNLVAKEFVCARNDERGVLVLSQLAGAAKQLTTALLVNPHVVDESASALRRGLAMSRAEQSWRMRQMRTNVEAFSATWWAQQLVGDATQVAWVKSVNDAPARARPRLTGGSPLGRKSAESHLSTRWRVSIE
jgi:trehalose 6-phosphate synthase